MGQTYFTAADTLLLSLSAVGRGFLVKNLEVLTDNDGKLRFKFLYEKSELFMMWIDLWKVLWSVRRASLSDILSFERKHTVPFLQRCGMCCLS